MQRTEAERTQMKRTRTAKACMHCRRRRIKCTGGHPCASCTKLGRTCVYETGPKKPRISHKGVITTLKAENQRLRAEVQGLRMFSGLAGVSVSECMSHVTATPKAEELPFMDAYLAFEDSGLFKLVGRSRFASVLSVLRSKKSGRGTAPSVPALSREDTALYFSMLAIGATLRRQDVPAMSYAARVRSVLAESFDAPSETMVRVALLLAVLHGGRLDVAKEASYLSTALQMLALLHRITGKAAPRDLVATAGSICSIADGPLPFATPKDLECDDPVITLSCLITQVAGVLMHAGSGHEAAPIDYKDLEASCAKAAALARHLQASGVVVPASHSTLISGLHAIVLFHLHRRSEATVALNQCMATTEATLSTSATATCWLHPVMAFVLRHVAVMATTMGVQGGDKLATQVHHIAMSWHRGAVYFRGLQSEMRAFDDVLRAHLVGGFDATSTPTPTTHTHSSCCHHSGAAEAQPAAPGGGSPTLQAAASSCCGASTVDDAMCFDLVGSLSPTCPSLPKTKKLFTFVQMVALSFGKPFNTCPRVLATTAAFTRVLAGAASAAAAAAATVYGVPSLSAHDTAADAALSRPAKRQRHRRQRTPAASPPATTLCDTIPPAAVKLEPLSLAPRTWLPTAEPVSAVDLEFDLLDAVPDMKAAAAAAPAVAAAALAPTEADLLTFAQCSVDLDDLFGDDLMMLPPVSLH